LQFLIDVACVKTSKALIAADDSLIAQSTSAFVNCFTLSCTINYASFPAYNSYKSACSAAKGALATYKINVSCDGLTIAVTNYPICLVSKTVNKNCGPKMLEDDIEAPLFFDDCGATAVYTSYTDYSGTKPKPVKKPAKKPVKKRVRF
jgi:hypothetical protein